MERTKLTVSWLWGVVRNPDVVFVDVETGEEASRERWGRLDRWYTLRPIWMLYALTTNPGCGCRKRFCLWHTIWCSKHCGFPEVEEGSE